MEEDLEQVLSVKTPTNRTCALRQGIPEKEEGDDKVEEEGAKESEELEKEQMKEDEQEEEEKEVVNALPPIPRKIRNILLGKILPANTQEAEEAASERRECLLRHKIAISGRKITARGLTMTAVPPEFAAPSRKPDTIACVCGNEDENDVEGGWVACDRCNVWQHVECMRDGVPKDIERGEYLCQQCDPFIHRRLIRRLRREHPLPDAVVSKGV